MNVNIRFLKAGLVKTETPYQWDKMSAEERLAWASEVINGKSDQEIIDAMADFENPGINGYFDADSLLASAIDYAEGPLEGEPVLQTDEFRIWREGDCQAAAETVESPDKTTVYLQLDDRDFHGECECGLCNANGIAYGVGIHNSKAVPEDDVLMRIYGPAEETALANAAAYCKGQGWDVVEFDEEPSHKK